MYSNQNQGLLCPFSFGQYANELVGYYDNSYQQRIVMLVGDWNYPLYVSNNSGRTKLHLNRSNSYMPSRQSLACPGLATDSNWLYSDKYNTARFAGYSYCIPKSGAESSSRPYSYRPHAYIPQILPAVQNIPQVPIPLPMAYFSANSRANGRFHSCLLSLYLNQTETGGGMRMDHLFVRSHIIIRA